MSDRQQQDGESGSGRQELIKFQVLVVALIWGLVLIALFRPLIFGRIIPEVLGLRPAGDSGELRAEIEGVKVGPGGLASGPEAAHPAAEIRHVVQPGETFYRIAIRYGVNPELLATSNHLVSPRQVAAGDVLIIPHGPPP